MNVKRLIEALQQQVNDTPEIADYTVMAYDPDLMLSGAVTGLVIDPKDKQVIVQTDID